MNLELRRHTNEELGLVDAEGQPTYPPPNPFNSPAICAQHRETRAASAPLVLTEIAVPSEDESTDGQILSESEVVRICREHFATFENLTVAGHHYGLTDGRLSQIQNGLYVNCPRILTALGIKRERGGVYRRLP